MTLQRTFKLRSFVNGSGKKGQQYKHYSLTVPNEIAERIPDEMRFIPHMTEEGILFVPVPHKELEFPSWMEQQSNSKNSNVTELKKNGDRN